MSSRIYDSIMKLKLNDQVLDFLGELEESYLQYLLALKSLGARPEKKFLDAYLKSELVSTQSLEQVPYLTSLYQIERGGSTNSIAIAIDSLKNGKKLNEESLNEIHKLVMEFDTRDHIKKGVFRDCPVYVGKFMDGSPHVAYVPPPPEEVPEMMKEVIEYYNEEIDDDEKNHPFIKSALVHAFAVLVHPYQDGNGRISRLLHHTKLWQDTIRKYNISIKSPAFYFSNSYSFARDGYTKKLHYIHASNFGEKEWNSWLFYNLNLMYEKLPYLSSEIENIRRYEEKNNSSAESPPTVKSK